MILSLPQPIQRRPILFHLSDSQLSITSITVTLFAFAAASAQTNLITENSAGKVKLGMTVSAVRKAVAPMKLTQTSDAGSEALDHVSRNSKVEWRLADGKPFAVIMRVFTYPVGGEFPKQRKPTGSFLVVKGLKGFESIDGRIDSTIPNSNEKVRELADSEFRSKSTAGV